MKARITTIMAMALACRVAMAADSFPAITTIDGKTYDHITAQRIDPDGIYIEYAPGGKGVGCAKIKFNRLSADLQKQYNYDPDAAKKYEDESYKANLAFQTWADQQEAARQKARAEAAARDFQEELILAQRLPVASEQAPADYGDYGNGVMYYGGGYPYGIITRGTARSISTSIGTLPADRLFTPLGFSPNKTQVLSSTPRSGQNSGGFPGQPR